MTEEEPISAPQIPNIVRLVELQKDDKESKEAIEKILEEYQEGKLEMGKLRERTKKVLAKDGRGKDTSERSTRKKTDIVADIIHYRLEKGSRFITKIYFDDLRDKYGVKWPDSEFYKLYNEYSPKILAELSHEEVAKYVLDNM